MLTGAKGSTGYSFARAHPPTGLAARHNHTVQRRTTGQPAGHPPFTFVGGTAPGQATGNSLNAFGRLWHDVTTSGSPASSSSSGSGDGGPGY